MDLPNLFNSPPAPRSFLAVLLTDTLVQAAVWQVESHEVRVVQTSPTLHFDDEKSMVVAVDEALQNMEQSEGVHEVVFGFGGGWVTASGILDTKKPLLKSLTHELSLKAVGFVVITEAMVQHLKQEDAQQTSLMVFLTETQVMVGWLQRGELKGEITVGKSGQLAADVVEALARLPKPSSHGVWPTKIELAYLGIDGDELNHAEQQLQIYDWVTQQGFLHPPTVRRHSDDWVIGAVVAQGGRAVAEAQGLLTVPDAMVPAPVLAQSVAAEKAITEELANVQPVAATQFGFAPVAAELEPTLTTQKPPQKNKINWPWSKKQTPSAPLLAVEPEVKAHTPIKPKRRNSYRPFILLGVLLGVVTLVVGGFGMVWWQSSAVITLGLKTKTLSRDVTLTLDPGLAQSSPETQTLSAKVVTAQDKASKATPTTGVKLVGDKAKGIVVLVNKTDSTKTLSAGTKLASGKLLFTLDEETKIASASVSQQGSLSETRTYGKTESRVTAEAIGSDSNLAKDTELSVGDFANSSYAAVVKDGLSGGASREVRVVSEKDRLNLLEALKKELAASIGKKLKEQAAETEYVVPLDAVEVTAQTFDAKVGDEVEALNLDLEATGKGFQYQLSDLHPLGVSVLQQDLPSGYVLSSEPPQLLTGAENVASSSARVQLKANVSAVALPIVDLELWKKQVIGVSKSAAETKLKAHSEVQEVSIELQPSLFGKIWGRLPGRAAQIILQVKP